MNLESIREYALSFPLTSEDMAFGDDYLLIRVGGRIFVCLGLSREDYVVVKCDPDYAVELRDRYPEIEPAWHWNKRYWNQMSMRGTLGDPLIRYIIRHSYAMAARKLPKGIRSQLPGYLLDDTGIETDRLILRHWTTGDAEALYRYASDEEVSRMAMWPRHTSIDMSRDVIEQFFIPNPHTYAMVSRDTDEPIGCIGLVPEGDEHYAVKPCEREAGYWIGRPYWNRGLTTEALKALILYCRERMRLDSLIITTDALNVASGCVATKCGFTHIDDYILQDTTLSKAYRLIL